ncbi:MAG TPA: hypothetical protein QGH71_07615, partial [Candidatus Marinimicrobia bacterium]|nr:hypothetical protein [Candidatus Neomarinimicrobiota bacterium]
MATSISGGLSSSGQSRSVRYCNVTAAAPVACATESGISFGPEGPPAENIPSRVVESMPSFSSSDLTNPSVSNSISRMEDKSLSDLLGRTPVASITISVLKCSIFP